LDDDTLKVRQAALPVEPHRHALPASYLH